MFIFKHTEISNAEDLTLLAKNCCNSLISLKIGRCYLSKLGDVFRYAVRLEHFGGDIWDEENDLVGFQFPPNTRSLSIQGLLVTEHTTVLLFLNQIRKLKFGYSSWLWIQRCPNLEVLYIEDECGDKRLQVIGKFCKKLRKLTLTKHVTNVGLISLAKECTKLESLKVRLRDISYEALECLGTHLKNLRKYCMNLDKIDGTTDLPLDIGIRALLMGYNKLKSLYISLRKGGLTDVGLGYIRKYGTNLLSLSLTSTGKSNAGLVKLSEGCPRLRKLSVFNIQSLRYVC
ncbi:leucine-rich repeat, cysteine-containing subtype protein [Tanacetum coccineum]